jgi:hypothetical protein
MEYDLNEFYSLIGKMYVHHYKMLADYAIKLGYKPKRAKTKMISISFKNFKTKRTLLKFSVEKNNPIWNLKFYSTSNYTEVFDKAIKNDLELFNFKYVGCFECNRCEGKKYGYNVEYPDGRKYFKCGFDLIPIMEISDSIVKEAIMLMENSIYHLLILYKGSFVPRPPGVRHEIESFK